MPTYTFIAHEISINGSNINVIGSSTFTLDLIDDDSIMGEPGDTDELASLDGAPGVPYSFEGVGTTDAGENMIVIEIGGVLYGFNRDGGNLQNGNTKLALSDLDDTPVVPCFLPGTMISTPEGPRAIESLDAGDIVLTRDNGPQPIVIALRRTVTAAELAHNPDLRPIRIKAGSLNSNIPEMCLTVSPQHRMLVSGWQAELLFGEETVLVSAKSLVNDSTITVTRPKGDVEYIHLVLDKHEIIFANGAPTESILLSTDFLNAAPLLGQCELMTLFPELCPSSHNAPIQAARPMLRHRGGQALSAMYAHN